MQTFKTKAFARFAKRDGLEDAALCEAVRRARDGLVDADLAAALEVGAIIEMKCDDQAVQE